MVRFLAIIAMILFVAPLQAKNEKNKAIQKLIKVSLQDATELSTFHKAFKKMISANEKLNKTQKSKIIAVVQKKLNRKEIEKLYVPIFAKHYSLQDVRGLLKFYSSPLGKKFLRSDPKIRADLHKVGLDYGQKVMGEIAMQMQQLGARKPSNSKK